MYNFEKTNKIEQLCDGISKQISRNQPPKTIYHYTSAAGLLGIIQSGSIWATNYNYLNDKSEVRYSSELVKNVLDDEINKTLSTKKQNFLLHFQESVISKLMISDLYLTSFSIEKDLLSQWRAYCPSEGGFCVGFNSEKLIPTNINFILSPINYNSTEQKSIIIERTALFYKFHNQVEKILDESEIENPLNPYFERITNMLLGDLYFFKNPAFHEENEIRAIHWISDSKDEITKIKFYEARDQIIPYIELIPTGSSVTEIIVGPSMKQDQLLKVLPLLSYKYGMDLEVSMYNSQTPLRNR